MLKASVVKALNGSLVVDAVVMVSVRSLSSFCSSWCDAVLNPLMELTGLLDPACVEDRVTHRHTWVAYSR